MADLMAEVDQGNKAKEVIGSSAERLANTQGSCAGPTRKRPMTPEASSAGSSRRPWMTDPGPSRKRTWMWPRWGNGTMALHTLESMEDDPNKRRVGFSVFAVVTEVHDVRACPVAPCGARDLRLADPTTNKRVLLSVHWKPEDIKPEVGTPVLFRGVKWKSHEGGCLNAYRNAVEPLSKERGGRVDWWVPWPRGWEGCDVDGYEKWWRQEQDNNRE